MTDLVVTTPTRLARELGINPKALREWLRHRFPSDAPGKGGQWTITLTMIVQAARHFA